MKITREDLDWFSSFVKKNGLENKFEGCQVYSSSIYLSSSAHNYLNWKSESEHEVLLKVVKAINALFDLDLELV